MKQQTVYVGLDYHQRSVQVCVLDATGRVRCNRRVRNRCQDIVECVHEAGKPDRVAIEACAGAADLAEELMDRAGWSIELAHPGYVRRMKANPDKTDYSDAEMLADLTRVGYLPKVWLAPEAIRELRRLVRHRQELVNSARATKQRIRALLRDLRLAAPLTPWTKPWLWWLQHLPMPAHSRKITDHHIQQLQRLKEEIRQAEHWLTEATADDAMVAALRQQSGIGPVTAWMMRAEIGRFDRFTSGKQLARFCGLSPRNASSGERQADAGLVRAGNAMLRAVLIEAAWRLTRHDQRWSSLARRMMLRGKPRGVVVVAVANRWIRRLYHDLRPLGLAA